MKNNFLIQFSNPKS